MALMITGMNKSHGTQLLHDENQDTFGKYNK
jgi:hypothetical protein